MNFPDQKGKGNSELKPHTIIQNREVKSKFYNDFQVEPKISSMFLNSKMKTQLLTNSQSNS